MEIIWVNHASFILKHKQINLICDPWTEGTAFNNGWALLSKSKFNYEDYKDITHIWFSHEHPDHFSPPNLKKISPEHKKNITVIYQETIDEKVIDYCRKAGFKEVISLKPDTKYKLAQDFIVMCNPFTDGDSWLYVETPELKILNLNDCIVTNADDAKSVWKKTGDVDLLLTQFSYANWAFNKDEKEKRRKYAIDKLERIKPQSEVFNPKAIIPFASFVWFCHEDNFYLNDGIITIDEAVNYIEQTLHRKAVVLYPGDKWHMLSPHDNTSALEKYRIDYAAALSGKPLTSNQPVDLEKLKSKATGFCQKIKRINKTLGLLLIPATKIFITDYNRSYTFSIAKGLNEADYNQNECDIAVSASNLLFCFEFLWGGDTLNVNGCFQVPPGGSYENFRKYFSISSLNNRGEVLPSLTQRIANKVKRLVK